MTNPYDILGINRTSSKDEAQASFRKLARKYHPDMVTEGEQTSAEAKFKTIKEAWEKIKDGWVEEPVYQQKSSFTRPSYHKPVDPGGTWRTKEHASRRPYRRQAWTEAQAPYEAKQNIVEGYEIPEPIKNLGEFIARVSLAEAYNGFIVEIVYKGETKQFTMPKGVPNNFAKNFDVDGGQISISTRITQSAYTFKGMDNAVFENTIVNGIPTSVVRTGNLTTMIEVNQRDIKRKHTVPMVDCLGESFLIQIPAGGIKEIKIPNRGYVDWFPMYERCGDVRRDLFVHVRIVDVVPMS